MTIEELGVVHHRGGEARAAILHPTAVYDPRCACCAVLLSEPIEDAGSDLRAEEPGFVYPNAHRVRLAVGTGPVSPTSISAGPARAPVTTSRSRPSTDRSARQGFARESERMPNAAIMPKDQVFSRELRE